MPEHILDSTCIASSNIILLAKTSHEAEPRFMEWEIIPSPQLEEMQSHRAKVIVCGRI